MAALGFIAMAALTALRVPGALIIVILAISAIGMLLGISPFNGIAALPPDPSPTLLQLDIGGALDIGLVSIVFTFLFVDLFDTAGTLIGVSHRAGLLDKERSEEHTSELQSLMRISYAVFCLKKNKYSIYIKDKT